MTELLDIQDELSIVSDFIEMICMATRRTLSIEERAINALAHEIASRAEIVNEKFNNLKGGEA